MLPSAACARRPVAFAGPPVATTPVLAFDVRNWFNRDRYQRILEEDFKEIVDKVEVSIGIPQDVRAQLFGLYKQACSGNAGSSAGLFGDKEIWEAWTENADMSKVQAMQKYVRIARKYV